MSFRLVPFGVIVVTALLAFSPAVLAVCGDGVVDAGEECDDGSSERRDELLLHHGVQVQRREPRRDRGGSRRHPEQLREPSAGSPPTRSGPPRATSARAGSTGSRARPSTPSSARTCSASRTGASSRSARPGSSTASRRSQGTVCSAPCIAAPNGTHLGVNCSDPYGASLNGTQTRLGPKVEVNAYHGRLPLSGLADRHDRGRDLQAPAGAQHRSRSRPERRGAVLRRGPVRHPRRRDRREPAPTTPPTARSRSALRPLHDLTLTGSTQRQKAGDPGLEGDRPIGDRDHASRFAGDGLFILSAKATSLGGGVYHYEYAVQNLTTHRVGAVVQRADSRRHRSSRTSASTTWTITAASRSTGPTGPRPSPASSVTWATQTYAVNQNANALRWGTLYNFRFDANVAPASSTVTIGLFRSGSPASIPVLTVVPSACAATEAACGNGVDDDCDGHTDCTDTECCSDAACSGSDADGDHFAAVCDCNDANPTVYPGATQLCDGINNNCSAPGWPAVPANEADADGDGVRICGGDCDDASPAAVPGESRDLRRDRQRLHGRRSLERGGRGRRRRARLRRRLRRREPGAVSRATRDLRRDRQRLRRQRSLERSGRRRRRRSSLRRRLRRREPGSASPAIPRSATASTTTARTAFPRARRTRTATAFEPAAATATTPSPVRFPGNPEVCDGLDNDCDGNLPPDELDSNDDGLPDCQTDCDAGNALVWATPGEVRSLEVKQADGVTSLTWAPPLYPGGMSPRYDTIRSSAPNDFVTAADCIETDGTDTESVDLDTPNEGEVSFYVIRCENDCPLGEGTLGTDSSSTPRLGRMCP